MNTTRRVALAMAAGICLAASGCAAVIVGAGVGAGTFSYIQGELTRPYPLPFAEVMNACVQVLEDLGMPTGDRMTEGSETRIATRRKDGTPVAVTVRIAGLDVTEVAVRTGHVGLWERDFSEQLHRFFAERLRK